MFFSKMLTVAEPVPVAEWLAEQRETIRKADILLEELRKINVPKPETVKKMYEASNTLKDPLIDMNSNSFVQGAQRFFSYMDTTVNYITHPVLILNAVAGASYWICGLICIAGILYYVIGHDKGVKWAGGSLLGYTLIQIVNSAAGLL